MPSHNADIEKDALIYGVFLEGNLHKAGDPIRNFIRIKKFSCTIIEVCNSQRCQETIRNDDFSQYHQYNNSGECLYGSRGVIWHSNGYTGQPLRNKSGRKPKKATADNNYFSVRWEPAICFSDTFSAGITNPIERTRIELNR